MLCDELMNKTWTFYVICVRLIFLDVNYVAYSCKLNSRFYLGEKLRSRSIFYGKMQKIIFCSSDGHHLRDNPTIVASRKKMPNRQRRRASHIWRSNRQCHTMSIIPHTIRNDKWAFPRATIVMVETVGPSTILLDVSTTVSWSYNFLFFERISLRNL